MQIVTKEKFWAAILADPTQHGQIQTTDPEYNKRAASVYEVLKNTLISSQNRVYIELWEKDFSITPTDGATIDARKVVILDRVTSELPRSLDLLAKSLNCLLGAGRYNMEQIPGENILIIHTDRIAEEEEKKVTYLIAREMPLQLTAQRYNHNIEISWRDINKYATCTNLAQMKAVNADFANDLTSEGEWVYPLPELVNCSVNWGEMVFGDHKTQHGRTRLKKWCVPLPKLKFSNSMFRYCEALENEVWELPSMVNYNFCMFDNALKNIPYIKLILPSCTKIDHLFHYGATKAKHIVVEGDKITSALSSFPYMKNIEKIELNTSKVTDATGLYHSSLPLTDFPLEYPALSTAPRMLINCQITGYQAITILNSIPTWTDGKTHEITLGIHIDYQNDAEVLAAIDNATAKGWTVTTQWTGTPTSGASTFGFKRIWARKTQDNMGQYVDADGTRWQVEWCDMISAPDGSTPEMHGYELFRSVEAAAAYWELQEYQEPQEEEQAEN